MLHLKGLKGKYFHFLEFQPMQPLSNISSLDSPSNEPAYMREAIAKPLSIEEARKVHDKMMSWIFSTKYVFSALI
jgi:hypothetical protein